MSRQEIDREFILALQALDDRLRRVERAEAPSRLDVMDFNNVAGYAAWPPLTHFRDSTIPAGFSWASGGKFVGAPTVESYSQSILEVGLGATTEVAFLYQSLINTTSKRAAVGINTTSAGLLVGVRLDDGSDNNYKEVVLESNVTASRSYCQVGAYSRTGGGAVSSSLLGEIQIGGLYIVSMAITGTAWSAWSIRPQIGMLGGRGNNFWIPNADPSGGNVSWTPTRAGLVFYAGSNYATFMRYRADWFNT